MPSRRQSDVDKKAMEQLTAEEITEERSSLGRSERVA